MVMWLERLMKDLRYGLRNLVRTPIFTAAAVLAIALGVGANTTVFSVINGVLIQPLPFRDPDSLVMIDEKMPPRFDHFEASPLNFLSWKEQNTSFSDMAAYHNVAFSFSGADRAEYVTGARVSTSLPKLLGVEPILGRSFTPEEEQEGKDHVILLGYDFWQRRFAGDTGVLGRSVQLDSVTYTVIGVMPQKFNFPQEAEIWKPLSFTPGELADRSNHFIWVIARLKPGVALESARADMGTIVGRLQKQFPDTNGSWSVNVFLLKDHFVGKMRTALFALLAAAGLVLLIACANVANLLLARSSARQREIAVRAAVGANRGRIIRQLLTESILLALLGGTAGVLLAGWSLSSVLRLSENLFRLDGVTLDYRALAFAFAVSAITGILFGLAPALELSRLDLQKSLSAGARTAGSGMRNRLRMALVVAEVAIAMTLLIGAGLLVKSFQRLTNVQPGFRVDNQLTAKISLPKTVYPEPAQQQRFVQQLLERAREIPGVAGVSISSSIPLTGTADRGIHIDGRAEGRPDAGTAANYYAVTPEHFKNMGIPLIQGRLFTEYDTATSQPVAIINQTMARRFFPNESPLGKRIDISGPTYLRDIVGVVGDVKQESLEAQINSQVYEPFFQKPRRGFTIVVRTIVDPLHLAEALRREVAAIDKDLPISAVASMEQNLNRSLSRWRFSAFLFGAFALIALLLATVGIYSVVAYSVTQRTREIGIRMALGADRLDIIKLIVIQTLSIAALGIGLGLGVSFFLSRFLQNLLYEVEATDLTTLGAISIMLFVIALVAAVIPALRATKVNPIIALRYEE